MKRILLVALMVLMSLVGMVGFSRAGNEVIALQSATNPTIGAVNEVLDTGYDLDTVYDWDTVYDLEKVYARVPARCQDVLSYSHRFCRE